MQQYTGRENKQLHSLAGRGREARIQIHVLWESTKKSILITLVWFNAKGNSLLVIQNQDTYVFKSTTKCNIQVCQLKWELNCHMVVTWLQYTIYRKFELNWALNKMGELGKNQGIFNWTENWVPYQLTWIFILEASLFIRTHGWKQV